MVKILLKFCAPSALLRTSLCSVLCGLFLACATTPTVEDLKKAEAYYKLGVSYLNENKLRESFIEFQKAISLNQEDKDSLNALGLISTRFKEYDKAINYYKRAISIDPHYSEAMNNLGVTYLEIENWDEAIKYFKMALENPLYATPDTAHSNIGYALYKKGDYLNALNTLNDTVKKYPESPQSAYILGLVYMKLNNIKSAIDNFNKAVTLSPKYIDARWELANAYLREGNKGKAIEHFKIVAESNGDTERTREASKYIELLKE